MEEYLEGIMTRRVPLDHSRLDGVLQETLNQQKTCYSGRTHPEIRGDRRRDQVIFAMTPEHGKVSRSRAMAHLHTHHLQLGHTTRRQSLPAQVRQRGVLQLPLKPGNGLWGRRSGQAAWVK